MSEAAESRRSGEVHVGHPACPFCKERVGPSDDKGACDACMAWQHAGCWREHGGCAACGRPAVRPGPGPLPRPARSACPALGGCTGTPLRGTFFLSSGRCKLHTGMLVGVVAGAAGACMIPFLDLPLLGRGAWRGDESQWLSAFAVGLYLAFGLRALLRVGLADEEPAGFARGARTAGPGVAGS